MASRNRGDSSLVGAELSNLQPHTDGSQERQSAAQPPARRQSSRRVTKCRYFGTKKGCRAGDACAYVHDSGRAPSTGPAGFDVPPEEAQLGRGPPTSNELSTVGPSYAGSSVGHRAVLSGDGSAPRSAPSMAVQKPVSHAERENPREYQINQIRRRFNPQKSSDHNGTHLKFKLIPTDPDFQFDLGGFECLLHVPFQYPSQGLPTLEILNQNLDEESRMLVQQRFERVVRYRSSGSLLQWMNALDRQLQEALTQPRPREDAADAIPGVATSPAQESSKSYPETKQPVSSRREKVGKSQRRQTEIRQLVSRLGRDPLFRADADGVSYVIPIKPMRPDLLSNPLRQLKTVLMIVPLTYPLEPCRIEMTGINDDSARSIEGAFVTHTTTNPDMSLMAHVNYLAATMHKMESHAAPIDVASDKVNSMSLETPVSSARAPATVSRLPGEPGPEEGRQGEEPSQDRPHIHVVPRPPEWAYPDEDGDSGSDISNESWSEDTLSDNEESGGGVAVPGQAAFVGRRRVLLSFPRMELHGIELLSMSSLALTLKCERCKEQVDVKNIKIEQDGTGVSADLTEICSKCSSYLRVGFHRELMHAASNRAGTLHLDGCTAVDLVPGCNFIPTCSECSTNYPSGVGAVRGDHKTAICRECHNRMGFKLPELKFLLVTSGEGSSQVPSRAPRKPKESLGIVAGRELPRRGRCSHYGRSYRWFRFSCCLRVFPCDRCHDAATDHPNEHANRMICGICSREQNYRPEDCGVCHSLLVGKAGSGFWEGGKGTRNKALMSRKDPRKYKRRGGTAVGPSQRK